MSVFAFNPADADRALPEGTYDAVITDAKKGMTKNGDEKLQITLQVYGPNGEKLLVDDHITEPYGIPRLRPLCNATDVEFNSGEVDPAVFIGKSVKVRLRVRESEQYGRKNDVTRYYPDTDTGDEQQSVTHHPPQGVTGSDTIEAGTPVSEPTFGRREAFKAYREKVRAKWPDASAEALEENFKEACKDLVPGKDDVDFTEADWKRVAEGGSAEYVPF